MRIAVSGTHYSGKTTLIAALSKRLPEYTALAEPYRLMEEEGYAFSDPPSLEDFEEQFAYSIELIRQSGPNTLFDRSPFDFLAYAEAMAGEPPEHWLKEVPLLDLIVFVPLEEPDRIQVPKSEDLVLRSRVDEILRELLLDSSVEVLEVNGSPENRIRIVMERLIHSAN